MLIIHPRCNYIFHFFKWFFSTNFFVFAAAYAFGDKGGYMEQMILGL